jgi:hypothetical protein
VTNASAAAEKDFSGHGTVQLGGRYWWTRKGFTMNRIHVVERAYQLARTPDCLNTGDVVKALSAEGYSSAEMSHFQGSSIRADLNRICKIPVETEAA